MTCLLYTSTKDTQEVAWNDRYTFDKEGYRMIGVNVGVKKIVDKKGNEVNDKKVLTCLLYTSHRSIRYIHLQQSVQTGGPHPT